MSSTRMDAGDLVGSADYLLESRLRCLVRVSESVLLLLLCAEMQR